jgi:hypothetical protein
MAETTEQPENTTPTVPLKVNFNPNSPVTLGYAHFDSFDSIEKCSPFSKHSPIRKPKFAEQQPESTITWFYRKLLDLNNYIFQNGLRNGFYLGMVFSIMITDRTETIDIITYGIASGCVHGGLFELQHSIPAFIPSIIASIYAKTLFNRYRKK